MPPYISNGPALTLDDELQPCQGRRLPASPETSQSQKLIDEKERSWGAGGLSLVLLAEHRLS